MSRTIVFGATMMLSLTTNFPAGALATHWSAPAGGLHYEAVFETSTATGPFDHAHGAWTWLLRRFVSDGRVDYAAFRREGQAQLDEYLASLSEVDPGEYLSWTEPERLAFWINAYNAFTIRLVLDHYPLKSIRSIGLFPGSAFRRNFIPMPSLRGGDLSLNDIEHEILRKEFSEPRIHFAIVCASASCPVLRPEAYVSGLLEAQLERAAREFLADGSRNRYDALSDTLYLSLIFEWFEADFRTASGSVWAFVQTYLPHSLSVPASAGTTRIRHLDYDWSLNGR